MILIDNVMLYYSSISEELKDIPFYYMLSVYIYIYNYYGVMLIIAILCYVHYRICVPVLGLVNLL
jgi:hypothetical protein